MGNFEVRLRRSLWQLAELVLFTVDFYVQFLVAAFVLAVLLTVTFFGVVGIAWAIRRII